MFLKRQFRKTAGEDAEEILIRMGDIARDAKRYVAAAALYGEALIKNPNNAGIHIQCGHMHKECGQYSIAEEHYLAARTIVPNDPDLALQLGHLYKVRGWPQQALDAYFRASQLKPGWTEVQAEIEGLRQAGVVQNTVAMLPAPTTHETRNAGADWLDCHLDEISASGRLRGWALGDHEPARLSFLVDGAMFTTATCNEERPDVHAAKKGGHLVGFDIPLPLSTLDGKEHVLEIRDSGDQVVSFVWQASLVTACHFARIYERPVLSDMDGPASGVIKGWVLAEDPITRRIRGGCDILVTCDDVPVQQLKADRYRADVGMATGKDSNCGYQFSPSVRFQKPYPQTFRFFLLPEKQELKGSPISTSFLDDAQGAAVLSLIAEIERLHIQLTKLRTRAQEVLPQSRFTLLDYHAWARRYFVRLRERVDLRRASSPPQTLISVIMPTYRPLISDFLQAIESVFAQTYGEWELIIADDGSGQPELEAIFTEVQARDPRVHVIRLDENSGISNATNAALSMAKGEWIAFFDHDDLLVDVALEVMVEAAINTGALVLYSDEDKIDPAGYFQDPALKPDWNHRLLLNVNYVCHLLFVERHTLQAAGKLDPEYDGAQDHDLILRLSEMVTAQKIHHVPEILYHWRMTASSTALQVSAKPYAIEAGIRAVAAHLERINRPAKVTNILNSTLYDIEWKHSAYPMVSIIIPFKDNVDVTQRCLESIHRNSEYENFEVVLVDNWSTSPRTLSFVRDLAQLSSVRVIRVEEDFNYSRLNNTAVETCTSPFLFFMNNDLFVDRPDWLRVVLDEALADPQVGIVGGKFHYPNGRIQHAGVVLGIGGVAGHVHSGRPKDEGGYAGRALFAQELSAVTGAGMLVRSDIFNEVGGFDEVDLKVAFNDIDLCLKVRRAGYKIIWTPKFTAEHHESLSRGSDDVPEKEARFFAENQIMLDRWGPELQRDPFYNPHFVLNRQPFFDLSDPDL